jgi:hypothetical protein
MFASFNVYYSLQQQLPRFSIFFLVALGKNAQIKNIDLKPIKLVKWLVKSL